MNCAKLCQRMTWRQLGVAFGAALVTVILLVVLTGYQPAVAAPTASPLGGQAKQTGCYTREGVASAVTTQKKCLTIYNGGVYDFTVAKKWDLTGHVGKHLCGKEYDKESIEQGPHPLAVIEPFKVGVLCGVASLQPSPLHGGQASKGGGVLPKKILGMSWLVFSAYLSLVFFVLNFLTCYAMPWATVKEPWKGDRPGKDKDDLLGAFPLTHMHKIWAWLAIFTLTLHGLIGFSGVLLGKWY